MATGLGERVHRGLEGLTPGYFALVMASCIISVGMKLESFAAISGVLLVISASAYVVLLFLTAWRFVAYRQATSDDFNDPRRSPICPSQNGFRRRATTTAPAALSRARRIGPRRPRPREVTTLPAPQPEHLVATGGGHCGVQICKSKGQTTHLHTLRWNVVVGSTV